MTRPDPEQRRSESDWQRRRRLAEVFGDTLPDTTSDEHDPDVNPDDATTRSDSWLKEQVPPHHGS